MQAKSLAVRLSLSLLFFLLMLCQIQAQDGTGIQVLRGPWGKIYRYQGQEMEEGLALQLPLMQSQDPLAMRHFVQYKKQRKSMQILGSLGAGLALYQILSDRRMSPTLYWSAVGGLALGNIYLGAKSQKHLNLSITQFNTLRITKTIP